MSDDPPSFLADVAARVVAWHNRHPLARRITRKDVQGIGSVELPYARDGQRPWHAAAPRQGLLALLFARRPKRRQWPLFTEALVPELGRDRIDRFARRHGLDQRPGPHDLPQRVAEAEAGELDLPGPAPEYPPERFSRHLLTAVIDIGPDRPRLMLGDGPRPAVLGARLWSLPRLAILAGTLLLALVISAAALWLKAMPKRGGATGPGQAASGPPASAAAARPDPRTASAAHGAASGAVLGPAAGSAPGSPHPVAGSAAAPAAPAGPGASDVQATPSAPGTAAPPTTPVTTPAPSPASGAGLATTPALPASAGSAAPSLRPAPASTAASPPLPMTLERPGPPQMRRASQPLVPRLRPDLAEAARAEAERSGLAASLPQRPARPASGAADPAAAGAPAPAGTPPGSAGPGAAPGPQAPAAAGTTTPGAGSASAVPARFYALVTRPVRSKAEAEALMRRLRVETDRINHPTANQTGLLQAADGWRVTWWPFTGPRQADNARAALARRIDLEVVEF